MCLYFAKERSNELFLPDKQTPFLWVDQVPTSLVDVTFALYFGLQNGIAKRRRRPFAFGGNSELRIENHHGSINYQSKPFDIMQEGWPMSNHDMS